MDLHIGKKKLWGWLLYGFVKDFWELERNDASIIEEFAKNGIRCGCQLGMVYGIAWSVGINEQLVQ